MKLERVLTRGLKRFIFSLRMKKIILIFIFTFFSLICLPGVIYAQESTLSYYSKEDFYDWGLYYQEEQVLGVKAFAQEATSGAEPALAEPTGLLPDSPFYFFKTLRERLQLLLTFDPLMKEELKLRLAEERAAEYSSLLEKGKIKPALAALNRQQIILDEVEEGVKELKARGQDPTMILAKLEEQVARHEMIMQRVLTQVPDEAKEAIERAIKNYEKHMDVVAEALEEEPIPPEVKERLEALKQQGILTADEVGGLYALPTRQEVRERLWALMEEGFLPEADFDKLNRAQERLFEKAFEKRQELDKFAELEKIESKTVPPEILPRIEAFRQAFKPGDPIPGEIRYFLPLILRREELRQTLRLNMIDEEKLPPDAKETLERFKEEMRPTRKEIEEVEKWEEEHPTKSLPKQFQRIKELEGLPSPIPPMPVREQPSSTPRPTQEKP